MYLLGVDIGSYSTKGALLSGTGELVATATRPHQMRVPAPGLAEHDAEEDWWGGLCSVTRQLLDRTGIAPGKTPEQVEEKLVAITPARWALHAHHWLILHGRYVCKARKPECPSCLINDLCEFRGKTKAPA